MFPELGITHALLLQGPAGPFFARFAEELRQNGIETTKVNFHAGDAFFYRGPDTVAFKEPMERWPAFCERLMEERGIDGVFVFGDCRPMHREAIRVAEARGAKAFAFEEGYLRPDWITLEAHGVNGNSHLPRDPDFYRALGLPATAEPLRTGPRYTQLAWYSTLNALAFTLRNAEFPHYRHHRILNAWYHTFVHCRSVVRKEMFLRQEAHILPQLEGRWSGRYFFVPLQVHCDFQLVHSPYDDVMEMVREVIESFAAHAPEDHALVFKHHPMDRAYREYGDTFEELARGHGLEDRLIYCHDLDLGTILEHAVGTVTINSTVGLTSIARGTPVKALGTAIYDMEGLTAQGSLESFWHEQPAIDRHLYEQLTRYLAVTSQANGSFYKPLAEIDTPTGLRWFPQPAASVSEHPHGAPHDVSVR